MASTNELNAKIADVLGATDSALSSDDSQKYQILMNLVESLDSTAREALQAGLKSEASLIVKKLENGDSLSGAELDLLKLFIVGDASYYVQAENDVQTWQAETARLMDEIKAVQAGTLTSINGLMGLRALCHDALRVLPDLAYYYQAKERVARFEQATEGGIDDESAKILADVVRRMLNSSRE